MRVALILVFLSLLAFPALAATPCNLEITLTCNGASCTSTTFNRGATTCSGEYFVGMFTEQAGAGITGFLNSLGLGQCFDSSSFPTGTQSGFAFCLGEAQLAPGASFNTAAAIHGGGTVPVIALTEVIDPDSDDELAFVYASNNAAAPTCTPTITVPPVTLSGVPYQVSWSNILEPNPTWILEESASPDFSLITSTRTFTGSQTQSYSHLVTNNQTFYYRVHAAQCGGAPGPFSTPVSIVVQAAPPATSRGTDAVVPFGTTAPVSIPLVVKLTASGKQALDNTTFTATTDKSYLTVTPSSGTVPPSGSVNFAVTASPGSLPPGANTGTVIVTTNTGQTTNVPVSVSLVTPVSPTSKNMPPGNAMVIPVVTHVNGAGGPFQSDVRLTNSSLGTIKYQITYTPTQTDGTTSSKSTIITVDSGQTIALNDIVKDFFGIGATGDPGDAGAGALEIRPLNNSSTLTYASSRTFVTTDKGTLGQFIAAIPFPQFATKAASIIPIGQPVPTGTPRLSLQQVAQSAKFRTNLGIVEGAGAPASGRIRVFDDHGTMLKELPFSLRPGEHKQLNQFISLNAGIPTLDDGRIEVLVDSDTGAVSAYASVLDNATTDPLAVTAVQPSQVQATRYVIPGMSELISPFSNFHSDVRIFNGGAAAVTVTPVFYPQGNGTPVSAAAFTLAAGEVKAVDNVLPTMFNTNNGGGSIVLTTNIASSLIATGRTYSNADTGGTYGQFIPGVSPAQGIGMGDRPLQILQLEQSQNFRTNLGLAELTGNAVDVHVTLILPDAKFAPATDVHLQPNEFQQLGRIIEQMNPGQNTYNARLVVQVTGGSGRVTAYGSVIDNFTADPTYVPAQ